MSQESETHRQDVIKGRFVGLADVAASEREWSAAATRFEPAPPLLDPPPRQLSFAFAENLFALFRAMSHLPGAELIDTPELARHHSSPFNPMFKGVWQARFEPETDVDLAIEQTISWFREREAPFFFWWVDPRSTPSEIADRLEAHGFTAWELDAPGMAANLDTLDYSLLDNVPDGYSQQIVTDEGGLADFKAAFVAGFEVPDWAGQAWVDATHAFGIESAPWQCYVGRLNGTPVSCTMLFLGAGVASVFGVATVAQHRGQGLGAAITLAAYQHALSLGYRYGVLFGTELGVPVYRRIGFREVPATMSRYLWRSD